MRALKRQDANSRQENGERKSLRTQSIAEATLRRPNSLDEDFDARQGQHLFEMVAHVFEPAPRREKREAPALGVAEQMLKLGGQFGIEKSQGLPLGRVGGIEGSGTGRCRRVTRWGLSMLTITPIRGMIGEPTWNTVHFS